MTVRMDLEEMRAYLSWAVCHDAPYSVPELRWLEGRVESALNKLNASAPQCLDDPPNCSHRLVPDRQPDA